jgi:hypothetical protein
MRVRSLASLFAFALEVAAVLTLGCSRTESGPQPVSSRAPDTTGAPRVAAASERGTPDAFGVPLPAGAMLVSSSVVDDVQVIPSFSDDRGNRTGRIAGTVQARGEDHVYRVPMTYEDVVAFYNRSLTGSPNARTVRASQRASAATHTAWTFEDARGNPDRVEVRGTTPTTIEVVAVTGPTQAVHLGAANTQPRSAPGNREER